MIVTFCGHRTIYGCSDSLHRQLSSILTDLFQKAQAENFPLAFYCGGYGEFDSLVSREIDSIRLAYPGVKNEKIFVTPYITPSYKERNDYMRQHYDDIIYPPIETAPYRLAIVKRNEWMIQQADLVIAFVIHSWGGAAYTLEYAEKKQKKIILLHQ